MKGTPPAHGRRPPVWLFDLDNTLHDAGRWAFGQLHTAMSDYVAQHVGLATPEAQALAKRYWHRYGATLLGLMRHHGVRSAHFLHTTHQLPGLEAELRSHAHDLAAQARLPGRRYILTNAPRAYALRVLDALGLRRLFEGVICIEDMAMFGHLRPKPDARMLHHVARRLGVRPAQCVLVEDTLGHLKSARRLGMGTVWMQRYVRGGLKGAAAGVAPQARKLSVQPAYVDRKVGTLRALLKAPLR